MTQGNLGMMYIITILIFGDGFMDVYVSKCIKWYTLNICNLLYPNYTSIKLSGRES